MNKEGHYLKETGSRCSDRDLSNQVIASSNLSILMYALPILVNALKRKPIETGTKLLWKNFSEAVANHRMQLKMCKPDITHKLETTNLAIKVYSALCSLPISTACLHCSIHCSYSPFSNNTAENESKQVKQ